MTIADELKTKESDVVAPVNPKAAYVSTAEDPVRGTLPKEDLAVVQTSKTPANTKAIVENLSAADRAVVDMGEFEAPVGRPLTDADVIQGFDLTQTIESDPASDAGQPGGEAAPGEKSPPAPATPPAAPEPAAAKKYKVAGREFANADELAAYVAGLDANKVDLTKIFQPTVVDTTPTDPDPADIIFEDPKRAVELIKKQMREERDAERRIEQQDKQKADLVAETWVGFYRTNPDLVGFEDVVKTKLAEVPAKLSFADGLPILAEKVRARIAEMRNRLAPAEVVSVAVTTPTTKAPAPAPKAPEVVATSFIQELKGIRRKA